MKIKIISIIFPGTSIYESFNGTLLHNLKSAQFPIKVLSDGKYITQTPSNSLTIWNSKDDTTHSKLFGHSDSINALAVLSNGLIASASKDKTVKIWNSTSGLAVLTLKGHDDSVLFLTELKDKMTLASACGCNVKVWNTTNGVLLGEFSAYDQHIINGLVYLKDGRLAIQQDVDACFYDGSVCNVSPVVSVWNVTSNHSLDLNLREGTNLLFLVQLSNGILIYAGYYSIYSCYVNEFGYDSYSWTATLHSEQITFLIALSQDAIAVGANDGSLLIY